MHIQEANNDFVRDYLSCLICMQVVVDPWVSSNCKKIMCYECIIIYLNSTKYQSKCPQRCDKLEVNGKAVPHFYLRPNLYIQEILDKSTFICGQCTEKCVGSKNLRIHRNIQHDSDRPGLRRKLMTATEFEEHRISAFTKKQEAKICPKCNCNMLHSGRDHDCVKEMALKLFDLEILDSKLQEQEQLYRDNISILNKQSIYKQVPMYNNLNPSQLDILNGMIDCENYHPDSNHEIGMQ